MSQITPYRHTESTKKEQVASMFDKIAHSYDFLNHFLSLGIDKIWRRKAIKELELSKPKYILDVATGTGDFALEALKLNPDKIIGIDISNGMLDIARNKIIEKHLQAKFEVRNGDSEQLDFENSTFDAVTVSFGVRNFENLQKGISEIFRVLKPGGKVVILEFSRPTIFPVKQVYNFYFFSILPTFGQLFSKDQRAYNYLPESVAAFPDGESFIAVLKQAGFSNTTNKTLTFGISSIYTGIK